MRSPYAAGPDIQFAFDIITCFVALFPFDRKKWLNFLIVL